MRKWTTILVIAILAFIILLFILIKFQAIESPWFSGYSKQYVLAKEHLREAYGANGFLEKELSRLRQRYADQLDPGTRSELLDLDEELSRRRRQYEELLDLMDGQGFLPDDAAKRLMEEAVQLTEDRELDARWTQLADRMPEEMVKELQQSLDENLKDEGMLVEQLKALSEALAAAESKNERLAEVERELARQKAEYEHLDSLARAGKLTDSLALARIQREYEILDSIRKRMPEISIKGLAFEPVRAKRNKERVYKAWQVERHGFQVSFLPEVLNVSGGLHRTVELKFEYPRRVKDTAKPLTKSLPIVSGQLVTWEHKPEWPNNGAYIVRIYYNGQVLDSARFEAD